MVCFYAPLFNKYSIERIIQIVSLFILKKILWIIFTKQFFSKNRGTNHSSFFWLRTTPLHWEGAHCGYCKYTQIV